MLKVSQAEEYRLMYSELVYDAPELKELIYQKAYIFRNNPNDTRLRNHQLAKRLKDRWAFSITDDIRIMYKWLGKNTVRFLAIGSHEKVYKKN